MSGIPVVKRPFKASLYSSISAILLYSGVASAAVINATWDSGIGDWNDGTQWTFDSPPAAALFPDNDGTDFFNVFVDGGNGAASSPALNVSVTIDSLNISSGDSVGINNARSLTIVRDGGRAGSGFITNNGDIGINSNGSNTDLVIDGAVTLGGDGTGTVTLDDTSNLERARIVGDNNGVLTNNGNTIQGEGRIGAGTMGLVNQNGGLIDANVSDQDLIINPNASGVTNSATMRASNGGQLIFEGGNVNNAGGTIEAQAGSTVEITDNAVVTGGTIDVIGNGTLNLDSATVQGGTTNVSGTGSVTVTSNSTLSGAYNSAAGAQLTVNNTVDLTLNGGGTYNNAGNMQVNSSGSNTNVVVDGNATLSGGGTLTLNDTSNLERARIVGINNGVLTNSNHTIQGEGRIGVGTMGLVNQNGGVIDANVAGQDLIVEPNGSGVTNAATMRASNGGQLIFEGGNVNNAGGTIEAQAGSTVEITDNAVVTGGTIDVIGTGTLNLDRATVQGGTTNVGATGSVLVTGDSTLSGAYNSVAGAQLTLNNTFELTLNGGGTYNNAGDMLVNSNGTNTNIVVDGNATLSGGGTLTLNDTSNLERARIVGTNNGVLTNSNHTIQGEGRIGVGTMGLVNQNGGVIDANVAGQDLIVEPNGSGVANAATMRASNGGQLIFEGGNVNNAGGTIEAQAGSTVEITDGAVVTGGTIDVLGTGTVQLDVATVQGGTTNVGATGSVLVTGDSTLSGAYNSVAGGQLTVTNIFELTLDGNGTYNNAGDLLVNSNGSNTDIIIDGSAGDVTLSGGGTVTLNDTSNLERARIRGTNNGVLVNENNTIQGEGRIGVGSLEIVNQADGIIDANVFSQQLFIDANASGVTNSGTMRARNGGILNLSNDTIANAGGTIEAQGGSTVQLTGGVTIAGGTLTGAGTFRNLNTATLDGIGMTLDGATIDAGNLSTTTLVGNIDFNNNAALNVESNGSNTDIVIDGTVTLSGDGTGTVTLDDTSNLERARILGDNNGILRNAVTIQGEGQLGVDSLEIRNLAGGVIQANVTGQELIIDPNAAGMTNEGTVLATNNSTLRVQDGTMTNAGGRVEVDTGSVILFTSSGDFVQDSGETVLNGGTLESQGTAAQFNGGVLSGSGTVAGGAVFAAGATIAAGASPGIIDFSDDSVFNGLIEIEIAGLLLDGGAPNAGEINTATDPATTQFDQINVFGLAELVAGLTIDVSLLGGAALSTGDFFDIMTADLFQVDLGLINFILPSDFSISLVTLPDFLFGGQDRQALRLAFNGQSVEPTDVPEPGMFALFLIALIGIGAMRYRAMA